MTNIVVNLFADRVCRVKRENRCLPHILTIDRRWSSIIDELLRIHTLENDWDGEGTIAPDPALVDGAIKLAKYLQGQGMIPPDRVHACVNPTVNFTWHTPLSYIKIEVVSPFRTECRTVREGAEWVELVYVPPLLTL
jgi:hypothetical protein